jgi:hypothetical protein
MVIFVHQKKKKKKSERKEILVSFVTHLDEKMTMTLSMSMLIKKEEIVTFIQNL